MQLKHMLGVIGALVPIAYCGSLLYYFVDSTGSVEDAQLIGLGPTLLGLAVIGLLFFIPLSVKLVRLFTAPTEAVRRSDTNGSKRDSKGKAESEFDADAVLARYMAKRSPDAAHGDAPPPGAGPGTRSTFGRKVTHADGRTISQLPKA